MTKNGLFRAAVPDALNHRGMIFFIRKHNAIGQNLGQGGQGRLIGQIATGKQQRGLFAVQIGQFGL